MHAVGDPVPLAVLHRPLVARRGYIVTGAGSVALVQPGADRLPPSLRCGAVGWIEEDADLWLGAARRLLQHAVGQRAFPTAIEDDDAGQPLRDGGEPRPQPGAVEGAVAQPSSQIGAVALDCAADPAALGSR